MTNRLFEQTNLLRRVMIPALLAAWLGCAGEQLDYPRESLSGTIMLDGKLIESGYIVFEPKAGQPTQSGSMIENGKYIVPRETGAVPGLYSVGIFSQAKPLPAGIDTATAEGEIAAMKLSREVIPKKFSSESILTADVKAGGPNVFDFTLTTDAKPKR